MRRIWATMMNVRVMIGRTMLGNNSATEESVGTIVIAGNHSKRIANMNIRMVAVTKPGRVIPTIDEVDTKISGHLSRVSPAITPRKMARGMPTIAAAAAKTIVLRSWFPITSETGIRRTIDCPRSPWIIPPSKCGQVYVPMPHRPSVDPGVL